MTTNSQNGRRRRIALGALTACVACVVGLQGARSVLKQDRRAPATRESRQQAENVRKSLGIEAAAKLNGTYVKSTDLDDELLALDLASLVDHSELVMSGVVMANQSHVTKDLKRLATDYEFRVREVFAGPAKPGQVVLIRTPGGRVEFEGGAYADVQIPSFHRPQNDRDYLLFVNKSTAKDDVGFYQFSMGSQSGYELGSDGLVHALGKKIFPVPQKYDGQSVVQLLNELREVAEDLKNVKRHYDQ